MPAGLQSWKGGRRALGGGGSGGGGAWCDPGVPQRSCERSAHAPRLAGGPVGLQTLLGCSHPGQRAKRLRNFPAPIDQRRSDLEGQRAVQVPERSMLVTVWLRMPPVRAACRHCLLVTIKLLSRSPFPLPFAACAKPSGSPACQLTNAAVAQRHHARGQAATRRLYAGAATPPPPPPPLTALGSGGHAVHGAGPAAALRECGLHRVAGRPAMAPVRQACRGPRQRRHWRTGTTGAAVAHGGGSLDRCRAGRPPGPAGAEGDCG